MGAARAPRHLAFLISSLNDKCPPGGRRTGTLSYVPNSGAAATKAEREHAEAE